MKSKYIKSEKSKKLLETILLSIKSSKYIGIDDNRQVDDRDNHHLISTYKINIPSDVDNERVISSFSVAIKKRKEMKWFKYHNTFELSFTGYKTDRYKSNYEVTISDNQDMIEKLYDYLVDVDYKQKESETNKEINSIMCDISTTIEKKFKRDDRINEILN